MSLRDRQRAATRDALLRASADLVRELGADGLTTRAVAARAGVASGTVFAHFEDKAALLEALLHDHIERALDAAEAGMPAAGVVDQLTHLAGTLFAAYDEEPDLSRALLAANLFRAGPDRPLSAQLERFRGAVGELFTAARARGEIDDLPDPLAFGGFFALYFATLTSGLRGDLPPDARVPFLRSLLERLLAPASRSAP